MKKYLTIVFIILTVSEINTFSQTADTFLIKAGILADMKLYQDAFSAINLSTSNNCKSYNKIYAVICYGLKNYVEALSYYQKTEQNSNSIELAQTNAWLGNKTKAMEYLNYYFKSNNKLPISKIINNEAFAQYKTDAEWQKMWQNADYSELELKVNQLKSAAEVEYNEYFKTILDEALSKYSSESELQYLQSKYFENKKLLDAAQRSINQAITQKPGNDMYHYQKAAILQKNNKLQDALVSINEAINLNPFILNYYLARIEINKGLGNIGKVNEDASLVAFCTPENANVKLVKIQEEIEKKNYFTALTGINSLIEKDKTKPKYYIIRGNIYIKAQKYQNADNDYGMALDLDPASADANFGKGLAKLKLEDKTSACYYWQKASIEGSSEANEYLNKYCINKN